MTSFSEREVKHKKPRPARISLAERGNIKGENDDGKSMEGLCLPREGECPSGRDFASSLVDPAFIRINRSNNDDGSGYRKRRLHT